MIVAADGTLLAARHHSRGQASSPPPSPSASEYPQPSRHHGTGCTLAEFCPASPGATAMPTAAATTAHTQQNMAPQSTAQLRDRR